MKSTKTYRYPFHVYLVSNLGPNILLIGLLIWGIVNRIQHPENWIPKLIIVVVPLLLFSAFVSLNQPSKITDDGKTITFYGYGRTHTYTWKKLNFLKIKKFMMSDKVLVRISEKNKSRGRYWLSLGSLENSKELLDKLYEYESKIHGKKKKVGGKNNEGCSLS